VKKHSTVSRRDFMKIIGLGAAGVGAVAAPAFTDLDDAMASKSAGFQRSWYVKEKDMPTVEIDWPKIQRMDNRKTFHGNTTWLDLIGKEKYDDWLAKGTQIQRDNIANNVPGNTLKDVALLSASGAYLHEPTRFIQQPISWPNPWAAPPIYMWQGAPLPEYFGAAKYEGTPLENSRMMRSALRFLGASQVGFSVLDENTKKLIFTRHCRPIDGLAEKYIQYESGIAKGYETNTAYILPDKQLYVISIALQMSKELFRQGHSILRTCGNGSRYYHWAGVQNRAQALLNGLGYTGYGYPIRHWGLMSAEADAVLSGMSEMSRNSNVTISPEFGSVAGYFTLITDLPLEPTKPIDAGMFRFCHTCKKCAQSCPVEAISFDDEPTWEPNYSTLSGCETAPPTWSIPGKKTFYRDEPRCFTKWQYPFCAICMGGCTFNINDVAGVHELVKATLSNTSLLNGFFWRADSFYGFGTTEDAAKGDWWDKSLPTYGYDTSVGAFDGGYRRAK